VTVSGGLGIAPSEFNDIAIGVQPTHPFVGQLWIDDTPAGGIVPYMYKTGGFALLDPPAQIRLLSSGSPAAVVSSQTQDTLAFEITGLTVPTASALALNFLYTTTGSGSPLARIGLAVNGTTVNTTLVSVGYPIEVGTIEPLHIQIGRRDGGTVGAFFQQALVPLKVGITAVVPSAIITSIRVNAQMLGATRTVTFHSYKLWEYR
jgi:hypothetical protein